MHFIFLMKAPTEADPLPERRLSIGNKTRSGDFSAVPGSLEAEDTLASSIDDRFKRLLIIKDPVSPTPLGRVSPASITDRGLNEDFKRSNSLRVRQFMAEKSISAKTSSTYLHETALKKRFEPRLGCDDRSKSLSSSMLSSSALSGSAPLLSPDKPKPHPRKLDGCVSSSPQNCGADDSSSYKNPYTGRRSVSPYLLMQDSYTNDKDNTKGACRTTPEPTTHPVPMPRRKTSIIKMERTITQVSSSSSSGLSVPEAVQPLPIETSNKVKVGPGPPKPKKGIVRKTFERDNQTSSGATSGYPSSLSPFDDEDDDDEGDELMLRKTVTQSISPTQTKEVRQVPRAPRNYPKNLNPFGDDYDDDKPDSRPPSTIYPVNEWENRNGTGSRDIGVRSTAIRLHRNYNESLNDFAKDIDTSCTKRTPKKKAPAPPKLPDTNASSISLTSMASRSSWGREISTSASTSSNTTPSSIRKGITSDMEVKTAKMPSQTSLIVSETTPKVAPPKMTEARRKKRPAPSVPVPMRRDLQAVSLKAIQAEMRDIENKQLELEARGKAIELRLRQLPVTPPTGVGTGCTMSAAADENDYVESSCGDKEYQDSQIDDHKNLTNKSTTSECEEELMVKLFELVHEKNALFRRQAELMYIKRYQRLEEEQIDIEYQIRLLMSKPPAQRTPMDDEREAALIQKLVEVVELRNDVVDAQEMDRRRLKKEDEDIKAHRECLMNNTAKSKIKDPTPTDHKALKKKIKNDKKDKPKKEHSNAIKDALPKKTIKKLIREKYKTLKYGAATLKRAQ
ncbi:hypothetical protein BIW11_05488 [Tropilaelaps mercedesae]|uniref:BMERB domain-containing protein n=1 Tax=Tropilaelaps mercedesae TaxID=418985 RepID=A0A1V9Y219_9ACAR|nr:hypothetical protein BIW11_05488 [Tropilaelaps mercedesae]